MLDVIFKKMKFLGIRNLQTDAFNETNFLEISEVNEISRLQDKLQMIEHCKQFAKFILF